MRRWMAAGSMLATLAATVPLTMAAVPAAPPAAGSAPGGAPTAATTPTGANGPTTLESLAFLVGEWPATGGQPGAGGTGSTTFARGVQDKVIVRTNFAEYPASNGKPASRHDDLMVIYSAPEGGVRADYYDSEGHVIRYAVQSPAPGQAVFASDVAAGAPRFRLTYTLASPGVLKGEFAIAPPGTPDAFKPYLTWESHRKGEGARGDGVK